MPPELPLGPFYVSLRRKMKSVRSPLVRTPAKAPTGVAGVDVTTGGGLTHGRTTLLVGGPDSGKIHPAIPRAWRADVQGAGHFCGVRGELKAHRGQCRKFRLEPARVAAQEDAVLHGCATRARSAPVWGFRSRRHACCALAARSATIPCFGKRRRVSASNPDSVVFGHDAGCIRHWCQLDPGHGTRSYVYPSKVIPERPGSETFAVIR